MNDLEKRLTDALEAAARTVPDEAVSAFETPVRRRGLPARAWTVAALAAATVAAALVVPLVIRDFTTGPSSICRAGATASPPKASPLAGDPPGVPYLVDPRNGEPKYLQDGDVRVTLPPGQSFVSFGRVACGWVGVLHGRGMQVGHLLPSGTFQSYGETSRDAIALSPEDDRVAFLRGFGSDTRLVAVSVADGGQEVSVPVQDQAALIGWNPHGVWYFDGVAGTKLWKPGTEPVAIDTRNGGLAVWRTTDRMVLYDGGMKPHPCVWVVTLDAGNKLSEVLEHCKRFYRATLSPDGSMLVTSGSLGEQSFLATYEIPSGKSLTHKVPAGVAVHQKTVWEDAEHILIGRTFANNAEKPAMRCNVVTGACEVLVSPTVVIDPGYR